MPAELPPTPPAPLVWAELVTGDLRRAAAFYAAVLGWRPASEPGRTDRVVYLDDARLAGPICGIRPRTPLDVAPPLAGGAPALADGARDRWAVRLSPPRPPAAVDPHGDQLLRPRAAGPRIGRWQAPRALCFAVLRTPDVEGARRWMEGRLDALLEPLDAKSPPGLGTQLLRSAVNPDLVVAALVDEADPQAAGWTPAVQVPELEPVLAVARAGGALAAERCALPPGAVGTAAAELVDPGGAPLLVIEHGPAHGRR